VHADSSTFIPLKELSVGLRPIDPVFPRVLQADADIVQKYEIRVRRSARINLGLKRDAQIALLPDCGARCSCATVAKK